MMRKNKEKLSSTCMCMEKSRFAQIPNSQFEFQFRFPGCVVCHCTEKTATRARAVSMPCHAMSCCSSQSPNPILQFRNPPLSHVQTRVRGCWTHILLSLDWAPPAIFWVRRATSSCFSSSSCFWRSSLFLPQSCWALTLPDDCQIHRQHFLLNPDICAQSNLPL